LVSRKQNGRSQVETIRLRLLKIAAQARITARNLDPLCQGVPLEERLCLSLGGSALLKNPKPKTPPFVAKQKAAVRLKHSNKANPDWLPNSKPMPKTESEENEPTRRPIDNQATPREKDGLGLYLIWHILWIGLRTP
jgi:hypothetical protein